MEFQRWLDLSEQIKRTLRNYTRQTIVFGNVDLESETKAKIFNLQKGCDVSTRLKFLMF